VFTRRAHEGVTTKYEGIAVSIELSKQMRGDAIASIQRYFEENMTEPIGELPAGLLLNYFLEEIGPAIYNQAIADSQSNLQQRVADLDGELYKEAFQYWSRVKAKRSK
jgi:uncharacterized protein (DUF2164 family)